MVNTRGKGTTTITATTTETAKQTWDGYAKTWGPVSSEERKAGYTAYVSDEFDYRDPTVHISDKASFTKAMEEFQAQFPGFGFVTQWFNFHTNRSAAKWELQGPDGSVAMDGVSYGEYGSDGKLTVITGFFEWPPA